jgi:hypothetical protein
MRNKLLRPNAAATCNARRMRCALLLIVVVASCASESSSTCPTPRPASACSVEWQPTPSEGCEVPCVVPPTYTSGACDACRSYGGERVCEQTFEWDGQIGCCIVDSDGDKVRFFACR